MLVVLQSLDMAGKHSCQVDVKLEPREARHTCCGCCKQTWTKHFVITGCVDAHSLSCWKFYVSAGRQNVTATVCFDLTDVRAVGA